MSEVITKDIHYTVEYNKGRTLKRICTDHLNTAMMYYKEKKINRTNVKLIMEYVEYHKEIIFED